MPGRELTDVHGQRFWFDAGAASLDFVYTGGEGEYAVYEQLHEPGDVAAWAPTSPLFDETAVTSEAFTVTTAELAALKRLRATLWESVNRLADGRRLRPRDVAVLNDAAAIAPPTPLIGRDRARRWQAPITGSQLASAFARDAIALFGGPLAGRIRRCEGKHCALVFLDTSQPGARRWCSMQRCGNRTKQRQHRARAAH